MKLTRQPESIAADLHCRLFVKSRANLLSGLAQPWLAVLGPGHRVIAASSPHLVLVAGLIIGTESGRRRDLHETVSLEGSLGRLRLA
jgi:hypothetical protein